MATTFLKQYYDDFLKYILTNNKYHDFLFLTNTTGQDGQIRTKIEQSLINDGDAIALIANRVKGKSKEYSFEAVSNLVKECAQYYKKQFSNTRTTVDDLVPGREYKRILLNAVAHNFDNGHNMFDVRDPSTSYDYLICIHNKENLYGYIFEFDGKNCKYQSEKDKGILKPNKYNWANDAINNPNKKFLVFDETVKSKYKYLGVFECKKISFGLTENDAILELILSQTNDIFKIANDLEQKNKQEHDENERLSFEELKKKAQAISNTNKEKGKVRRTSVINTYPRSETIRQYIIAEANRKCADCGKTVGIGKENIPELQCHHVLPLSDGGKDTIENCVALCPNCHRHRHKYILKKE